AEGFTSGQYSNASHTWTVTDHDAHAWVEVWFKGFGWLPFDPTPGRGSLTATYSASSPKFDPTASAALLAGAAAKLLRLNTVAIPASAAPRDLVGALSEHFEVDAVPFAQAFDLARFGPPTNAGVAAGRARRELSRLERQLRSRLGVLRRARGLVSLRSLGFAG